LKLPTPFRRRNRGIIFIGAINDRLLDSGIEKPAASSQGDAMTRDIHHDARLLGGEVAARQIRCPGPGHRPNDRSLSLKPSAKSPIGYIFFSFAGDDPIDCLDYIRAKLGLPAFAPGKYVPPPAVIEPENDACPILQNTP
jgi:hypothetical protein